MRTFRDPSSPGGERVWFETAEMDAMALEARRRAGDPIAQDGGIDIDAILETVYGVTPDFVDLPDGVLGRTRFPSSNTIVVEISRQLSDAADRLRTSRHRLRSTLAHEWGHIAYHRHLCILPPTFDLFGAQPSQSETVLCRSDAIESPAKVRSSNWREFQANHGMSTILVPEDQLRAKVSALLRTHGFEEFMDTVRAERTQEFAGLLAAEFNVSLTLMTYRLNALRYLNDNPNLEMKFH